MAMNNNPNQLAKESRITGTLIIVLVLGIFALGMWGCPRYHVYSERKNGEAKLAKAQFDRQTAVVEAKAKMEAAAMLSQADTIRAHGTARSNEIIGKSLSPEYLNWLWITNMGTNDKSVIYVPAGNLGIPIQEATRLNSKP